MSRWFRHYAGMMRDEKLVRAALRSGQPVERVVWVWGAILESAAETDDGGRYEIDHAEIAYFLRVTPEDIASIEDSLSVLCRVSDGFVTKWGDRQFQSDRSAERQRRHRERHKASSDGDVTSPSRHGDAPETETETEAERKKEDIRAIGAKAPTRPPSPDNFEDFWKVYPRRDGANPKQPARKKFLAAVKSGVDAACIIASAGRYAAEMRAKGEERTPYVAQAKTWLSQQRWADYQPTPEAPKSTGPPPGAPSDDELRRKYSNGHGNGRVEQRTPERTSEGVLRPGEELLPGLK